jgi:hypothetical protein
MRSVLRVLTQLVVAGPLVVCAPLAILMGIGTIVLLFSGDVPGVSKALGYGLGWVGLLGLYGSILTPLSTILAHHRLRQLIVAGIVCGFIAAAAIVMENGDPIDFFYRGGLFSVWLLVGPVIVGAWNLARILITKQSPPFQ